MGTGNVKILVSSRPADDVFAAVEQQLTDAELKKLQISPPPTDAPTAVPEHVKSRIARIDVHASDENLRDMIQWLVHDPHSK